MTRDGFEKQVRHKVAEVTGYQTKKQFEIGQSGNRWKVDCVVIDEHGVRKGYIEVKETSKESNQSTYINHMRRAYAEMGDFRNVDVPKGVIVAEKRDFGRIDWEAMFKSIDCTIVGMDDITQLVQKIE